MDVKLCERRAGSKKLYTRIVSTAMVISDFAVFQEGRTWNITHIPTGGHVFNVKSLDKAKRAIEFMTHDLSWKFGHFGMIAKGKRYLKWRERAQAACNKFGR